MSKALALILMAHLAVPAFASVFVDAQSAARDGRYQEVVTLLGAAIESGDLDVTGTVAAYANRGVAYSLLGAPDLARQDLVRAHELDPDDNLTLNHLGLLSERVDRDFEAAAAWYTRAADAGYAAAQVNLAGLNLAGAGIPQDMARAFSLMETAARQGYVMAYTPLGEMYRDGLGTRRSSAVALDWFTKGAAAGVVAAHYYLGVAYQRGQGVAVDLARAAEHYQIAADNGHGEAQNSLGYLYRSGAGVAQDFSEAAKWYRLASDQGIAGAMNRLAWLLATCPSATVCDGEAAIALAQNAVKAESTPSRLDTLAAAYARDGQFDLAVETIDGILSSLPADSTERQKFAERLAQYRRDQPYTL